MAVKLQGNYNRFKRGRLNQKINYFKEACNQRMFS